MSDNVGRKSFLFGKYSTNWNDLADGVGVEKACCRITRAWGFDRVDGMAAVIANNLCADMTRPAVEG